MEFWLGALVGAVFVAAVLLRSRIGQRAEDPAPESDAPVQVDLTSLNPGEVRKALYAMAASLAGDYDQAAHPRDLLEHDGFKEAVRLLRGSAFGHDEMVAYLSGDNALISTLAAMALVQRRDEVELLPSLLPTLNLGNYYARSFVVRALEERVDQPLLSTVLNTIDASWAQPFAERVLREFVQRRLAVGDTEYRPPEDPAELAPEKKAWLLGLLREAGALEQAEVLEGARVETVDRAYLETVGKVWKRPALEQVVVDELVERRVAELRRLVLGEVPRSVLLVGDSGTGKTVALEVLAQGLIDDGWTVFEAGAVELLAGQSYVGQIEQRMKDLLAAIAEKPRVLWLIPGFEEMAWAGRHQFSTTSLLDVLMPFLESGRVLAVAEVQPSPHERLLQSKPALRAAMEAVRLEPYGDEPTLALAQAWSAKFSTDGRPLVARGIVEQSFQLAQQFLGARAQPGNLLGFLSLARQSKLLSATAEGLPGAASSPGIELGFEDLLATLGRLTGLPASILDDREGLDLASLERHFHERVIGQPEAISCLVERVAMIKAGLTDPTRPLGVFLFTGPTGSGKTEIAKTLAAYLFGSPDRMVRLDMSELQGYEALDRLLGERDEREAGEALVDRIRKQPFSVVLLDEIEKAHSRVFDLFLQVFDDGRLTDRRGRLADFRHAIVIMTSNVGAEATRGGGLGFSAAPTATGLDQGVEKALREQFRAEFLNRIDRIVVFRTLGRAEMHQVLEKELRLVLERRGLRNRQWAVEWDDSALQFFLDRGFSPELGARPLRRTIERFLLAPLARTIVNQKAPTGDQFLFVRSDGRGVQVEFVDPDAPEELPALREPEAGSGQAPTLGGIALDPTGSRREVELLRTTWQEIESKVHDPAWAAQKQESMDAMSDPDFWSRDDRFRTLSDAEYRDRIETGLDTATRLLERLGTAEGVEPRDRVPTGVAQRLAVQLHLLRAAVDGLEAARASDAFLRVEPVVDPRGDADATEAFARELSSMYRGWARRRRMDFEVLREAGAQDGMSYRMILSVAGFGAFTLLARESGLHVLEPGEAEDRAPRIRVRVTVVGQPDTPLPDSPSKRLKIARECLQEVSHENDGTLIVRRYRHEPSPLCRDSVRGFRTGRLDRVLAGDFDLMG